MLKAAKLNTLFLFSVTAMCIYAPTDFCDAIPLDIYDEFVGNDDKLLLLHMADLIADIGGDDSDYDSGRYHSHEKKTKLPTESSDNGNINWKDMKPHERCSLPIRKGVCRALIPRWSYDPHAKDCSEFKFGGCDGNR